MRKWDHPEPPISPCVRIFLEMLCAETDEIVQVKLPTLFFPKPNAAQALHQAGSVVGFPFVKRS